MQKLTFWILTYIGFIALVSLPVDDTPAAQNVLLAVLSIWVFIRELDRGTFGIE